MATHQPVQVTCKAEVFETKAYGKRQASTEHVLFIMAAAAV